MGIFYGLFSIAKWMFNWTFLTLPEYTPKLD